MLGHKTTVAAETAAVGVAGGTVDETVSPLELADADANEDTDADADAEDAEDER